MTANLEDLKRRHDNHLRNGAPVLDWDTFHKAATELIDADADLRVAVQEFGAFLEQLVPRSERRVGFTADLSPATRDLFMEMRSIPNFLHPSDLSFTLMYGKAKRNPLSKMQTRAKSMRAAAARLRRKIVTYTH